MTTTKTAYASAVAATCTLASLAAAAARASTAIDNSVNLYLDALVTVKVKTGSTTGVSTDYVAVYAYASTDGTTYSEAITGTDAALPAAAQTANLQLLGVISTPTSATQYTMESKSVAAAFGGVLPVKWGIVVLNKTAGSLDSTEANHTKEYVGVTVTNA